MVTKCRPPGVIRTIGDRFALRVRITPDHTYDRIQYFWVKGDDDHTYIWLIGDAGPAWGGKLDGWRFLTPTPIADRVLRTWRGPYVALCSLRASRFSLFVWR